MQYSTAIVGAGLAGCEAAWQLAGKNIKVTLFEMRPTVMTEVHRTADPAELVCSNSFKSEEVTNAHGLLKAEMEMANSLIVHAAKCSRIPAGAALAVDREIFSRQVKKRLIDTGYVVFKEQEVTNIEQLRQSYSCIIIATGPLTSKRLSESLHCLLGEDELFFYDAIAPIVYAESIDMDRAYRASRYGKGTADYLNCPMNRKEYEDFVRDLIASKKIPFKQYEQAKHFEGCMPIEAMAKRGPETLSYGPMKPVGLEDPKTGKIPWAVLQLRQENRSGSLFNLVGCQTRMTLPEQKRIFRKIPGLTRCEFARYGSMHRNTYVNAPQQLQYSLELKKGRNIFLAGQITGVEGYVESSAMGLWAAINVFQTIHRKPLPKPNPNTMIGGLVTYLQSRSSKTFQPMNANFGLLSSYQGGKKRHKRDRRRVLAENALREWRLQLAALLWE